MCYLGEIREPVLPPDVPEPLDFARLAWAAGFFDGEGTTIARSDARRPDYFQLEVSVPQSGPDGVPEVMRKFQDAMLGVGRIDPQPGGLMHKWCAGGRATAELSLALMWPWLGPVKRAQAVGAIDVVDRQYTEGRRRARPGRYRPTLVAHEIVSRGDARSLELAWAAGFLDAEGYFGLPRTYERRDESSGFVTRASASQHGLPNIPADVLVRLRQAVGGRIERHGEIDDFKWVIEGTQNVQAVLEAVRPWLGTVKITQAIVALAKAESNRVRGDSDRCVRGHVYDRIYVRRNGAIHRICNACDRMNDRAKRVASGGKPRALRSPSTDASRVYAELGHDGRGGGI